MKCSRIALTCVSALRRLAPSASLALEHLQHAVGDEEAADDVDRRADDGDEAEDRARPCRGREPAATSEPTSEMPEMAFVADMSGVCSSGGTRVMTW